MQKDVTANHSKIAVIGCGWLGLPLAKQLILSGYAVSGTARSPDKLVSLNSSGIEALPLTLGQLQSGTLNSLKTCKIWIVNIPSSRRTVKPEVFTAQMIELIEHAKHSVDHLVFISTTSVYGNREGRVTEESKCEPNTPSANAHVKIEQYIQSNMHSNSTVLRLAGLVDAERHPVKFLANKTDLNSPNQVVNLIHKQDVCNAIEKLIDIGPQSKALHLSSTEHPARENYYQWAADKLGLVKPTFVADLDDVTKGKEIDATYTLSELGLELKYPSPYQMLGH